MSQNKTRLKLLLFFIPITLLISVFENCGGSEQSFSSIATGSAPSQIDQSNPDQLTLIHSPNSKVFIVNWAAGSGNGGEDGCKIQYKSASDNSWQDILLPVPINCDQDTQNHAIEILPVTGIFRPWSRLHVRLVNIQTSQEIGFFSQELVCSAIGGHLTSTPIVDEDCNGQWDNYSPVFTLAEGCNANEVCGAYVNYYNGDGAYSISSADGQCLPTNGSLVRIYEFSKIYDDTPGDAWSWVTLPYSFVGNCGASTLCTTIAELRYSGRLCQHQITNSYYF